MTRKRPSKKQSTSGVAKIRREVANAREHGMVPEYDQRNHAERQSLIREAMADLARVLTKTMPQMRDLAGALMGAVNPAAITTTKKEIEALVFAGSLIARHINALQYGLDHPQTPTHAIDGDDTGWERMRLHPPRRAIADMVGDWDAVPAEGEARDAPEDPVPDPWGAVLQGTGQMVWGNMPHAAPPEGIQERPAEEDDDQRDPLDDLNDGEDDEGGE